MDRDRRVLFVTQSCYLDDSDGAAVASRAMMETLARCRFKTGVLCGSMLDRSREVDPARRLAERGHVPDPGGDAPTVGGDGSPPILRLEVRGVPIMLHVGPTTRPYGSDDAERKEFLHLFEEALARIEPGILVTYGTGRLIREVLARARSLGISTVFPLHNLDDRDHDKFADVDAVLASSGFAADYYRRTLGLSCTVLPTLVDHERVRAERIGTGYVTFVNPAPENGVYPFARIADELGRRRPDIPLLVVEGRGTEGTLAACGLDLWSRGNVNLMEPTPDPRQYWGVTRVGIVPSVGQEAQGLVAVEALVNGIPVLASDRGALPEILGRAGILLPLPERLTPATRILPTPEEVAPWVESILRLWDDRDLLREHQHRALAEARRWDAGRLEPQYVRFFESLRAGPASAGSLVVQAEEGSGQPGNLAGLVHGHRPAHVADRGPRNDAGQRLILGIGTGRSGSHSLADLLNRQHDAQVTHEQPPLLPWIPRPAGPGIRERLRRLRRTRPQRIVGDIASFYLPYLEEAIAAEPGIRVLCLKRPREEVVASFCRWVDTVHALPTDHWSRLPRAGWHQHPLWSQIFPKYDVTNREDGIRLYWDEYHRTVDDLTQRYPEHIRVFPIDTLNKEAELREMLSFAGIPEDRQVLEVGSRTGRPEQFRPHPRRGVATTTTPRDPRRCVVLVPYNTQIVPACEDALKELERRGYVVRRVRGYAAVDQARNQMATDALANGFEETMWIDSDIGFEADAVDRLRAHGEPIVCGIYPQKGRRSLACHVLPGTEKLVFGAGGGLREILYAGAGFLLVRMQVYMDMQRQLELPVCNEHFGWPLIPFFQPLSCAHEDGHWYLAEDYAFCERARRCGYRVLADTTIRLWHVGQYSYGWEDAGLDRERFGTFTFKLS